MAAMSCMIRKASSTVFLPALRAIASSRILFTRSVTNNALINGAEQHSPVTKESSFNCDDLATNPEKLLLEYDKVVKAYESDIKSASKRVEFRILKIPVDFPFTMQRDDSGELYTINLTRKLDNGERIDVIARLPIAVYRGTKKSGSEPSVRLNVKISKENGKMKLELNASASANDIMVREISVHEPPPEPHHQRLRFGPYNVNPDSDLQFCLRSFLEIRGLKTTYVKFLYEFVFMQYKHQPFGLEEFASPFNDVLFPNLPIDHANKKLLDHKLVELLESEIQSPTLLSLEKNAVEMPPAPVNFPFTIQQDIPGLFYISLEREFDGGEEIYIHIDTPRRLIPYCFIDDENVDSSSSTTSDSLPVHSYVLITKKIGRISTMVGFEIVASADAIKIPLVHFSERNLDDEEAGTDKRYKVKQGSNLDLAMRRFLEERGVTKNHFAFLYKYMVWRSRRDRTLVLEKWKELVKELGAI